MVRTLFLALYTVRWILPASVEGAAIVDTVDESVVNQASDGTAADETKGAGSAEGIANEESAKDEDGAEGADGIVDEESVKDLVSKMNTLKELLATTSHNHSPEMLEQMALLNTELAKLGLDFSDDEFIGDRAEKLAEKCFSMTYRHFKRSVSTKAHVIAFSKSEIDARIPADLVSNPLFRASATCMLNITPEEVKRFDHKLVSGLPKRLLEVMQSADTKDQILGIDIDHAKLLQDWATERRYEYEELEERKRLNPNYGVSGSLLAVTACFFFVAIVVLTYEFLKAIHGTPRSKAKVKRTYDELHQSCYAVAKRFGFAKKGRAG